MINLGESVGEKNEFLERGGSKDNSSDFICTKSSFQMFLVVYVHQVVVSISSDYQLIPDI